MPTFCLTFKAFIKGINIPFFISKNKAYEEDHDNVIELPTTTEVRSAVNEFITAWFDVLPELPLPPLEFDEALSRRFQKIDVNEPSIDECLEIISGIKPIYETYHNVQIFSL